MVLLLWAGSPHGIGSHASEFVTVHEAWFSTGGAPAATGSLYLGFAGLFGSLGLSLTL